MSRNRLKPLQTSREPRGSKKATKWQKEETIMYLHTNSSRVFTTQQKTKRGLTSLQKRILGASLSLLFLLGCELLIMKLVFAFA
jgi:hypothetical protein